MLQYLHSLMSMNSKGVVNTSSEKLKNVEMALEALRNVIKNHPGKTLGFCILRIPETSSSIRDSGSITYTETNTG